MDGDLQAAVDDPDSNAWTELHVAVPRRGQPGHRHARRPTGIEPAEALVRLRAHAYATGRTATDVARDILDRRLKLQAD